MGVFIRKSLPLICLFVFKLSSGLQGIMGYAWVRGQGKGLGLCNCETRKWQSVLAGLALCHAQVTSCSVSPFFTDSPWFLRSFPLSFPPLLSLSIPEARLTAVPSRGGGSLAYDWQINDEHPERRWRVEVRGRAPMERVSAELGNQKQWGLANKGVKLKCISPPAWMMIGWFVTGTLVSAFKCSVFTSVNSW